MRLFSALLLLLLVAACGDSPPDDDTAELSTLGPLEEESSSFGSFKAAFNGGADCAELFRIKNDIDPSDEEAQDIADSLRRVGCFSADSERQVPRGGGSDIYSTTYKSAYETCSYDPAETKRQAGTDDPEKAAEWLAEISVEGDARDGSYDGCLDGLTGEPNKFGS